MKNFEFINMTTKEIFRSISVKGGKNFFGEKVYICSVMNSAEPMFINTENMKVSSPSIHDMYWIQVTALK